MQTKRFNEESDAARRELKIYTSQHGLAIRAVALVRSAFGVDNVTMLSDHRDASFGEAYGTLIKEWRILSRAIFVVDANDVIQHVEYVKEVADHPNYDAALEKARSLVA